MVKKTNLSAEIAKIITNLTKIDTDWEKSLYLPVRSMTAKKKGVFGEKVYKVSLDQIGISYSPATSSDADLNVNGQNVEVKMGTRTNRDKKGNYSFTFFQIRQFQNYDQLVFVCVYPDRIDVRQIAKKDFMTFAAAHPKQIIWAGGKKKKITCNGDINQNDLFHFIIPNDQWGNDFVLLISL